LIWMDEWMNGWMDGWFNFLCSNIQYIHKHNYYYKVKLFKTIIIIICIPFNNKQPLQIGHTIILIGTVS
jgi:hypothetical protein